MNSILVYQESHVPCFCAKRRHISRLRAAFPEAEVTWCRTKASFLNALPNAQVALTWAFRQQWFEQAPKLRRIATPAAGRDFFPITPPPQVKVRYGTHHGPIMAETVLGLMLAFERGLFTAYRHQLQGEPWPREALFNVRLLAGSHAVIVGFGHIGGAIGRALKTFGVRITGVRRSVPLRKPAWFQASDTVVPVSRLDAALREADHLLLVLPSETGTDRLIDARRFALLPRHAVVYNVGRGNCIDEAALAEALTSGALRGACLDVFAQEPLTAGSPLAQELPGLVRVPHASAFTGDYMDRFLDEAIAWLKKGGVR
jgi:phosphoglycerate dehydrogenase-like enzyme